MPTELELPIGLIQLHLGKGAVLSEPLFFPELARLTSDAESGVTALSRALVDLLPRGEPGELLSRRRAKTGRSLRFTLPLDPPRKSVEWQAPVQLRFHAVVWDQDDGYQLARVPQLGIEVVATAKDDLVSLLKQESLAALRRAKISAGLRSLVWVQTVRAARLHWANVRVALPSLKERAVRAEAGDEETKSVLQTVASRVPGDTVAFEVRETVAQIAEALTAKPPQSVLLIGPSGVGKTAAFGELVRRAADFQLGSTPFYRTSGSRLVAGQTGFGMWEERCQNLIKEAAKKRIVLHLGSLVELMDVGKSECNSSGIASFLRPAIARGELLAVAECLPEQLPLIEKQDPQLLDAFRHVRLEEPGRTAGYAILEQFAGRDRRRAFTPKALGAVDRLHRRYATYSAYPGRPLRFLDRLRRDGEVGTNIDEAEVFAGFGRETGLPPSLIDPAVPLDPTATREWFSSRVIGQSNAVDIVVDLLATVKAGLSRPERPVASLLFVGPTGVGKTEMAKALAEFLFGSVDRLTRFDMSEYADPIAVRRLVGGVFASEGLLTAAVREQPFCVLLLDEVEKADRSVFDLLLQALGEARLTDAGGRLAYFRNTVVILTSNLGAESFRSGKPGFASGSATAGDAVAHFTTVVEKFLRPEMVNRLDRIVPFAALDSAMIRRIADREWNKVLARDGIRFRSASVSTDDGLLDRIAAVGFDPKYGARPLKRAMERELLAPLARQLNRHSGDIPVTLDLRVVDGKPDVTVRPVPGAKPRSGEPTGETGQIVWEIQNQRRRHQLLERSSAVRELENEVYQLTAAERVIQKRQRQGKPAQTGDGEKLARLGLLREVQAEIHRHRAESVAAEDEFVLAFHEQREALGSEAKQRQSQLAAGWSDLVMRLYSTTQPFSVAVTLVLFSENHDRLRELTYAYAECARRRGMRLAGYLYLAPPPESPKTLNWEAFHGEQSVKEGGTIWYSHIDVLYRREGNLGHRVMQRVPWHGKTAIPDAVFGIAMTFRGPAADLWFGYEHGKHAFVSDSVEGSGNVFATVTGEALDAYRPPVEWVRKGSLNEGEIRRYYNTKLQHIVDTSPPAFLTNWPGELANTLEPHLMALARRRLEQFAFE